MAARREAAALREPEAVAAEGGASGGADSTAESKHGDGECAFTSLSKRTRAQVDGFFYNMVRKNAMIRLVGCADDIGEDIMEDFNLRQTSMFDKFTSFCAMYDGAIVDKTEKTTACDCGGPPHVYIDHTLKTTGGAHLALYTEVKSSFCCFADLTRGEYHVVSIKAFKPKTRSRYYYAIDDVRGSCNLSKSLLDGEDMTEGELFAAQMSSLSTLTGDGPGSLTSSIAGLLNSFSQFGGGSGGTGTGVNNDGATNQDNDQDNEH